MNKGSVSCVGSRLARFNPEILTSIGEVSSCFFFNPPAAKSVISNEQEDVSSLLLKECRPLYLQLLPMPKLLGKVLEMDGGTDEGGQN